jgi:NAD(P)-dependent dehydrogenase (short-subunit alcohol dehydrogenase family)
MKSNRFDVADQVVLVTGAASGLGESIAQVMAEGGARLALFDIDGERLEAVASSVRKLGASLVSTCVVDVGNRLELRAAIDSVVEAMDRLDVVFCNAGIGSGPGFMNADGTPNPAGQVEAIDDQLWDKVLAVNLGSVYTTIQRSALHMKRQRSGRIIVTTSVASFRSTAWVGTPYIPAKAGAAHLVRQLAMELAPFNVTVNAMAPGAFATNIGGGRLKSEQVAKVISKGIPLGRVAAPGDIQGLALFLASKASAFITGAEIPIDGGSSL